MQCMELISETCNMALENIVTGATHFELTKTDIGGPRYTFFGNNMHFFETVLGKLQESEKG